MHASQGLDSGERKKISFLASRGGSAPSNLCTWLTIKMVI